jgi:VanZ family protein
LSRGARICWVFTIVYWCGLFALTHIPAPRLPVVPITDKSAHFISYGTLATALFLSIRFSSNKTAPRIAIIVLTILLAYGAIDEWTQLLVNRSCEMADWHADVSGATLAVVLLTMLLRDEKQ